MAAKKKAVKEQGPIKIPAINLDTLVIPIIGLTPLIVHAWSAKAIKMMEASQQGKAKTKKPPKNPQEEYDACFYRDDNGDLVFPATAFKGAMVGAVRQVDDLTMVEAAGQFHILAEWVRIYGTPQPRRMTQPTDGSKPQMVPDMTRLHTGVADTRYRPYFMEWAAEIPITFNASVINAENVANLLNIAGFSVGIGDWRSSSPKNRSGNHGMFQVSTLAAIKRIKAMKQ